MRVICVVFLHCTLPSFVVSSAGSSHTATNDTCTQQLQTFCISIYVSMPARPLSSLPSRLQIHLARYDLQSPSTTVSTPTSDTQRPVPSTSVLLAERKRSTYSSGPIKYPYETDDYPRSVATFRKDVRREEERERDQENKDDGDDEGDFDGEVVGRSQVRIIR